MITASPSAPGSKLTFDLPNIKSHLLVVLWDEYRYNNFRISIIVIKYGPMRKGTLTIDNKTKISRVEIYKSAVRWEQMDRRMRERPENTQ